jgi:hypothetical protein
MRPDPRAGKRVVFLTITVYNYHIGRVGYCRLFILNDFTTYNLSIWAEKGLE